MCMVNKTDSIWTKYNSVVEANKEKRRLKGDWSENECEELVYDSTCLNDYDEDGNLVDYPWEYTNLLSARWVQDLFGEDWLTVGRLLRAKQPDIVFVGEHLYYREQHIRMVLDILETLAKTNFVNMLRPIAHVITDIAKPVFSSKDLMTLLGVKEATLRKYRNSGLLHYSKYDDKFWYTQEDIDNFLHCEELRKHLPME